MQYALAARGWVIMPWNESAQMHEDKEVPMSGPKDAAFRHYSGPVGKPAYELKLKAADRSLVRDRPAQFQGKDPNCQICYSSERYMQLWGPECTNRLAFEYSPLMLERYHPNLKTQPCSGDIGSLCEPGKMHKHFAGALSVAGNPTPSPPSISGEGELYGFYLHVFHSPAAVIYQVRRLKEVFPKSPIYIMSDGGADFGPLCEEEGCTFSMCPPSNDRWHPWPFFRRLYDAALTLKTEFVIMLEPDNTIHGPIKKRPQHDAGGVLVRDRSFAGADYVEKLSKKRVSGYKQLGRFQAMRLQGTGMSVVDALVARVLQGPRPPGWSEEGFERARAAHQMCQEMPPVMAWPDGRLVTQDADGAFQVVGTCPKAADFEERQELLEYERAVMREVIGAGRNGTWAEDGQKEDAYFPHGARVLVVGDGDLSWSCSLIRGGHVCASNLTCTVLEKSEKEFLEQYRSEEVRDNMDILIGSDAKVLFNTDATSTQMDLYARCRTQLFNVIVWNFPYVKTCNAEARLCSSGRSKEERESGTRVMVHNFLRNAQLTLDVTLEVMLAPREVKEAAEACGLMLQRSREFRPEDFPGYCNRFGDRRDADRRPTYLKNAPRYHIFAVGDTKEASLHDPPGPKTKKKKKKGQGGQGCQGVSAAQCTQFSASVESWADLDCTVSMVCPDGEGMRGDAFGAVWWGMEELGMFVHKVFPGEPLHLTIKDQIPRPYEILPSGSILFSPGQEHKDLLVFKVLDIDGSGEDIDALNDKVEKYGQVIMAEDRVSNYPSVLRRNAGLQLQMTVRIRPMKFRELPEETRCQLQCSWHEELHHPFVSICRVHPRWHVDNHPVPDYFTTTRM
ncbi:unnamed protein product [Effrenium voratum]|uniref:25S rRNA (uridine-N(3))-methyltransferase BMT5-like domain-containing protein n=1 Tax=Effrenium voratum TaxID=2562239 RepID=A0AA36NBB6_9DINO|nr:unnamed protein product [Effrenium voratum]